MSRTLLACLLILPLHLPAQGPAAASPNAAVRAVLEAWPVYSVEGTYVDEDLVSRTADTLTHRYLSPGPEGEYDLLWYDDATLKMAHGDTLYQHDFDGRATLDGMVFVAGPFSGAARKAGYQSLLPGGLPTDVDWETVGQPADGGIHRYRYAEPEAGRETDLIVALDGRTPLAIEIRDYWADTLERHRQMTFKDWSYETYDLPVAQVLRLPRNVFPFGLQRPEVMAAARLLVPGAPMPPVRGVDAKGSPSLTPEGPVVYFFGHLSCEACIAGIRQMEAHGFRFGGNDRLVYVNGRDRPEEVAKYIADNAFEAAFEAVITDRSTLDEIGISTTPTLISVGADGRISTVAVGGDADRWAIKRLLK